MKPLFLALLAQWATLLQATKKVWHHWQWFIRSSQRSKNTTGSAVEVQENSKIL